MWEGNVFSICVCPQGAGGIPCSSTICHQMSGPGGGVPSHIVPQFATRCKVPVGERGPPNPSSRWGGGGGYTFTYGGTPPPKKKIISKKQSQQKFLCGKKSRHKFLGGGRGRYASCGHAGGLSLLLITLVESAYICMILCTVFTGSSKCK